MQETGWPRSKVMAALRQARGQDHTFADGSILGSMCTKPHPVAAAAHRLFLETNLGDPGHFAGTKALETEVIADVKALLNAPKRADGRFLTGGTEANLFAMYVAREATGKRTVVVPEHAHFSFEKAARLLGMRLRWVPSGPDGRADPDAMAKALGKDTALMVGVAGSTELGLVDDIPALGKAARAAGVRLHVDAAFGGYVLPFLAAAGRRPRRFDFSVPGVWSVGIDPHKGGMSTIPSGLLVLRDGHEWDHVAVDTPYVSTDRQAQLLGTRPGGAVAATWAVHRALGRLGFGEVVKGCLDRAGWLAGELRRRDWTLVQEPELNVVTFAATDAAGLATHLAERGIRVNVVPRLGAIRIVVNPHVSQAALGRLVRALPEASA